MVLKNIVKDLRNEGFYDDDIYDYLNNITLSVLHKKYENILNQLKKDMKVLGYVRVSSAVQK